jgi:hypothetical protein
MVKIFTMVKDEVDIIKDWIIYHGSMFGFNNIYVIDNYSTDGTFEAINEFSHLINIFREPDYLKKGEYMKKLINTYCNNEIAFPIDIDEFIIYYDNNEVSIDKNLINNYINTLQPCTVYKANYILSIIDNHTPNGYNRALAESDYGRYINMGNHAKSFFNTQYYKGDIDHGNHIHHMENNNYHLTKICLIHYHYRNLEQMKKKILNNITGLGYINDLNYLHNLINNNKTCPGFHHVNAQIQVLENRYVLPIYDINANDPENILLTPLKNRVRDGYF